ncbi:MAG: homogentisate 1,2-dioxygenase [Myxococcales bacterium]|nr:homogentisate 1,2-dioxygenase [Myxococcales bacterium]
MLERRQMGRVPAKHHIAFEKPDGDLYWEHCFTREGFDGTYTILYHQHRPHEQRPKATTHGWPAPEAAGTERPLAKRHFLSQDMERVGGPPVDARVPLLFNKDVVLAVMHPDQADPVYLANADGDELFFIFEGTGTLRTPLGELRFEPLDYVYVPRALPYRLIPDEGVSQYWLSMECRGGLDVLKQFRNEAGQLRMDAPYCHRDFRTPDFNGIQDDGVRDLIIKRGDAFSGFEQTNPICDVVGWDGAVYPWVFPMLNFQPRAGLVHLPPTWHGTFAMRGGLVCSFVPRVVDFHEKAIPCPYPHSSVDVDEFIFYVRGNFTSRKGVGPGSISYHPAGMPHGPHPGAYQASMGHSRTDEMAVMLDTFERLVPTPAALAIEDSGYMGSFIE